jgi:hypothetical protein
VTLRKVPGTLALGLLASLAAHAALFGGEHAMGGAYHALLMQGALGGTLSLVLFFGALAWTEAGRTSDGSVLAARLRERLPSVTSILPAAILFFGLAEAVEPHHAGASPIAVLLVLPLAAWFTGVLARGIIEAIAGAVIAAPRTPYTARAPSWKRRARVQPIRRRPLWSRRRFARPPPIAIVALRA